MAIPIHYYLPNLPIYLCFCDLSTKVAIYVLAWVSLVSIIYHSLHLTTPYPIPLTAILFALLSIYSVPGRRAGRLSRSRLIIALPTPTPAPNAHTGTAQPSTREKEEQTNRQAERHAHKYTCTGYTKLYIQLTANVERRGGELP
ncbi:hypothetical protein F5B17DRAFT_266696 [Nemania serpens]|nr:hypothetical protein F5B17DRAFT_266696 [Nemania serpens]